MPIQNYYLGCPIWSNKYWVGELFTSKARPKDFLKQYASVFNTVEGNTTFYGLPTKSTVQRWRAETPKEFRFCFKFPRTISHDKRLVNAESETSYFLDLLAPLGKRLGPFFLQLPPSFGVREFSELEKFLDALPHTFQYAVEVRHPDYFDNAQNEKVLNTLLTDLKINRVVFDTRGIHAADARDLLIKETQHRKPRVPVRFLATGNCPFIRFVGYPEVEKNTGLLKEWVVVLEEWISERRTPYIFMHMPNDLYAPYLARHFHELLKQRFNKAGKLPRWPSEKEQSQEQLSLF